MTRTPVLPAAGLHRWQRPDNGQVKARMRARRTARTTKKESRP
ncbi:MAG TPA: hypothetical protein VFY14_08490 [Streptomyces sp.]|nr:hypothetical protein [Streptomyces sp.]